MLFWVIFKVGLKSLWANKLRSMLAMLGIIIGVGAVISMLAMGAGAKTQILERISAMGTNLLIIWPQQTGSGGVKSGTSQKLSLEDAQEILNVEGVRRVAPIVNGSSQVKYYNQNTRVTITGSSSNYLAIHDFEVEKGRGFTDAEAEGMYRVAVLGPVVVDSLFGKDDPLGQTVKIGRMNFTVVGVTKAKGGQRGNPDEQVFIPYTTAMNQLFGLTYIKQMDVQAEVGSDLKAVQEAISDTLRKRHRIQPGAPDDFGIFNQADIIETFTKTSETFTVLLGGIASISLLVGGIGIMNIMLVTVTERTREIGIRKAIGAKERSVLMQFLVESMMLSGVGGLLGVGLGLLGAWIINQAGTFAAKVEPFSVILALSFSGVIGIFFGLYPAWRAARLDPVESLRYE
jgi:putative ABC transport system permease protein